MVNDGEGGAGLKLQIWVILGRVFNKGKVWTIKDGIEGGQKTDYIFADAENVEQTTETEITLIRATPCQYRKERIKELYTCQIYFV